MTGKSVIGLVLLTSTFLSSSVKAAALTSAFEELRQKAANSGEVVRLCGRDGKRLEFYEA